MKPTNYELLRRTAVKAVETCPGVEAVGRRVKVGVPVTGTTGGQGR